MNPKLILGLALVLVGGLFGCSTSNQPSTKAKAGTLNPPSAEQLRIWVGYPESVHFNLVTNNPNREIWLTKFGKLKWVYAYEHRKGRSFDRFEIAVFEPGAVIGTNRANIDRYYKQRDEKLGLVLGKAITNESINSLLSAVEVKTLPSGRKSYGTLAGFSQCRFSFHTDFDLMVTEFYDSMDNYQPEEKLYPLDHAVDKFYELFTNIDEFLDGRSYKSKP